MGGNLKINGKAKHVLLHLICLYNEMDELRERREGVLAVGGPGHLDDAKNYQTVIDYLKARVIEVKQKLIDIPE